MAKSVFIITVFCILVVSFIQVNALKCWMCTSTNEHTDFCKDPFQGNKLNETFKTIYLKECQKDEDPNYRNVCKKLVMEVEGKEIIERRCHAEKTYGNPTQQECVEGPNSPATSTTNKIIYCQTCTGDGCNGASIFTPFVILLLAPIALVKILSL